MQTLGRILVVVVIVAFGYFAYQYATRTPCDRPLEYRIGEFNAEFGISQQDFLSVVAEAEEMWERAAGKDLFVYNPQAAFTLNLVFDERQRRTLEAGRFEDRLDELKQTHDSVAGRYEELLAQYKTQSAAYERDRIRYEQLLRQYNADVERWNRRGGAPQGEYEALERRQRELVAYADELERDRVSLNELVNRMNDVGNQGNVLADRYNDEVETYAGRFGEAREFNQGEYHGDAIDIYQFDDRTDLLLVMAHELGHALSIGHVENPQSIMYYLMGEQDMNNPSLTTEDVTALRGACKMN